MDKTIPAGAAILLRFISKTEVSREAPGCYATIYGHNEDKLSQPITTMTLAQIQAYQGTWSTRYGSSATGAYQFMKATLAGLIKELNLPLTMKFDGDLQDRLGYHLLKRRGYTDFVTGKISRTEFAKRLAQEWASFPVLAPTQGAKRSLTRGQSYYAGDGLNKALVKPEAVEDILNQVLAAGNLDQAQVLATAEPAPATEVTHVIVDAVNPADKPAPAPATPAANVVALSGFAVAVTAIGYMVSEWFSAQACGLVGLLCGG